MKNVLIILPTYNEADNIGLMLARLLKLSRQILYFKISILVVDDNSPDGTASIVVKYQVKNDNLFLVSGQKTGLGDAYIRGMKYGFIRNDYFAFIMMDADFSHNPKEIPKLLGKLDEGYDCVIGSRYTEGGFLPGNWPLLRVINSKFANYIAKIFGGFDNTVTDLTGGFKAIRVDALNRVNFDDIIASGYFFQVNLLYALTKTGSKVTEVPISFADRKRGSSKLSTTDIFEFLYKLFLLNPDSRIRRVITFAMVGTSGTIVNLLILSTLLKLLHLNPIISDMIAIESSIITNYYLNNRYTFQNSDKEIGRLAQFIGASKFNAGALVGAFISLCIFTLLFKFADVNYLIADMVAILLSMSWNYWISVKFVWGENNADS